MKIYFLSVVGVITLFLGIVHAQDESANPAQPVEQSALTMHDDPDFSPTPEPAFSNPVITKVEKRSFKDAAGNDVEEITTTEEEEMEDLPSFQAVATTPKTIPSAPAPLTTSTEVPELPPVPEPVVPLATEDEEEPNTAQPITTPPITLPPMPLLTDSEPTNSESASLDETKEVASLSLPEPSEQQKENIMGWLNNHSEYSIFTQALKQTGLDNFLMNHKDCIVFAPNNTAFLRLPQKALQEITDDLEGYKTLIGNHIIIDRFDSPWQHEMKLTALSGDDIKIRQYNCHLMIGGYKRPIRNRIKVGDGFVMEVNTVLVPPQKDVWGALVPSCATEKMPQLPGVHFETIARAVSTHKNARIFMKLVRAAGLEEKLEHGKDLIVFVPRNTLLKNYLNASPDVIKEFLMDYIVEGIAWDNVWGSVMSLKTAVNKELSVNRYNCSLNIQGYDRPIVSHGVRRAKNGVMVVVDAIL